MTECYAIYYQQDADKPMMMRHGYAYSEETAIKICAEYMYEYRSEGVKAGFVDADVKMPRYPNTAGWLELIRIPTVGECNRALNN